MNICRLLLCLIPWCQGALSTFEHVGQNSSIDVLDYIDLLIGSRSGGNVFAGATLPYGMVKGPLQVDEFAMHH